jgi:hypothetical protein
MFFGKEYSVCLTIDAFGLRTILPSSRIWLAVPREEIAAQLGRTVGATAVEASKLGLSLRRRASEMTH